MDDATFTIFQYQKDLDFPIYVQVDLAQFQTDVVEFLTQMKFYELSVQEATQALSRLAEEPRGRMLTLEEATPIVARQIDLTAESDRFGLESIVPKDTYRVYRYQRVGLMVYSHVSKEWRLGCFKDFGSKDNLIAYRSVINRYLSYALAPLGIIGFWGVPVEEGMVVLRQADCLAEAVFVDVRGKKILSVEGVKDIHARFKILRLDPNLKNRNIRMQNEELFSFLSTHTTYFAYEGLSVPVRQMLSSLSRITEGLIHPRDSFKPRTDLSL